MWCYLSFVAHSLRKWAVRQSHICWGSTGSKDIVDSLSILRASELATRLNKGKGWWAAPPYGIVVQQQSRRDGKPKKCLPKGSMGNMGSVCVLDTGLVLVYRRHFLWSWGALPPLMKAKDLVPASCPIGWLYVIVCKHECTHLSYGRSPCPTEIRHSSTVRWWEQGRML